MARTFFGGWVLFLAAAGGSRAAEPVNVAAHYYPWYDSSGWNYQECALGTLRGSLRPAEGPLLGNYLSSSQSTIDTHLRWCSEYNISTLILEFYGPNSEADLVCRNQIFRNPHASDVRFSLVYDWAIRFGDFSITASRLTTVSNDFRHLAQFYLSQPNYLRSPDGRAVVMLYVSRALSGDLDGFARVMRDAAAAFNQSLYLVGDEFFYIGGPDTGRIRRWDAIFGYDVYGSQGGYWGNTGNANFFNSQMTAFRKAANSVGTRFFPSVTPGFNDRAVRRTCANNPAAARRLTPDGSPVSLFASSFDYALASEMDPEFPLLCITSFNEWHEDTMIEPTAGGAASTSQDTSASATQYTQGLMYDDYGFAYLEFIRDRTVAVSGHVVSQKVPVPGARVEVRIDGKNVAVVNADTFGGYKVLRPGAEPGANVTVQVVDDARGISPPQSVTPQAALTVINTDLELVPEPVLQVERAGAKLSLRFASVTGIRYQWMTSPNLRDWAASGDSVSGTGDVVETTVDPLEVATYFQLKMVP